MAHQILLSSVRAWGVPDPHSATTSARSPQRCFRGPRREARLPTNAPAAACTGSPKWGLGTRSITWRWSRWRRRQVAQGKIRLWDSARQRAFHLWIWLLFVCWLNETESKMTRFGQDGIYQAMGFGLKSQSESYFPSSY